MSKSSTKSAPSTVTEGETDWNSAIPFIPPITTGYVIKVYDGDTITIACRLPFEASPLYKFSVRLNGIDTPEIKTKNPEEKARAQSSKNALSSLCLNRMVSLENVSLEKYGRVLADVYCDGLHLNQYMIDNGHAVKYDGGHKKSFEENFS
jgi:endonuclease YncB( thermonuclease family)